MTNLTKANPYKIAKIKDGILYRKIFRSSTIVIMMHIVDMFINKKIKVISTPFLYQ